MPRLGERLGWQTPRPPGRPPPTGPHGATKPHDDGMGTLHANAIDRERRDVMEIPFHARPPRGASTPLTATMADEPTLERLFADMADMVHRAAHRITGSAEDAE